MRLPWQKESTHSLDSKKQGLKELMSVGNSSTGSFESPVSERGKLSKMRKEGKKSDGEPSSEDKSPIMAKKSPADILKSEKSTSLDVPKASKHLRKSVDISSLAESSMAESQKKGHDTLSSETLPVTLSSQSASHIGSSSAAATPEEKKEKKKKKPKGLGAKPPKMGKDGKMRRVVSFSEYVERLMPTGKIESAPINTHECGKGEVPYHKRGKDEYKMKKALLKAAALAAGGKADEKQRRQENAAEEEEIPSFNLMISTDDEDHKSTSKKEIEITDHAINFLGPLPQSLVVNSNGLNISVQSLSISRYSPNIKGVLVIGNSQKILPAADESHFLKTDIHLYFDDWDTKKSVSADVIDSGVLNMLLKTSASDPLKDSSSDIFVDPSEKSEKIGLLFTIPIEEIFLPSLYEMLKDMGMDTGQSTFEVEGVLIIAINIYKSVTLFRGSSLEGLAKDGVIDSTLNKLDALTLQNSLSNEKSNSSIETDSGPVIQISESSVTDVYVRNVSAPLLPDLHEFNSNPSAEISASFDTLNRKSINDSTSNFPLEPQKNINPESRNSSQKNSGSTVDINDQLVVSAKFEIRFSIEKGPNAAVKRLDLLHVGYLKPNAK